MSESRSYDAATGHLTAIASSSATAETIQNLAYSFDPLGNLLSRINNMQAIAESFQYDALNRVTASTLAPAGQAAGGITIAVAYDGLGNNITSKWDTRASAYWPGTVCA